MNNEHKLLKNIIRRKLTDRSGMTLVELLCAVVVAVMATAVMVTAIGISVQALTKSTQKSEGQILCSTLSTAVQDEIRYADDIKFNNSTPDTITYFSRSRGQGKDAVLTVEDGKIVMKVMQNGGYTAYPLVSSSDYVHNMTADMSISDVKYDSDGDAIYIKFDITVSSSKGNELADETFAVEPLN